MPAGSSWYPFAASWSRAACTALQLSSAASDPVWVLGVLAAYETQAAAVAATKAAGLRRHYGIDGPAWRSARGPGSRPRRLTASALAATVASPAQVTSAAADGPAHGGSFSTNARPRRRSSATRSSPARSASAASARRVGR